MLFNCIIILLTIFSLGKSQINNDTPIDENQIEAHNQNLCSGDLDFDCGEQELQTRCISSFWMCDNVYDCTTGADEVKCNYLHKCPIGHFMCLNGDCIHANNRCNGHKDCLDGSDERGCQNLEPKKTTTCNSRLTSDESSDSKQLVQQYLSEFIEHQAEAIVDQEESSSLSIFMVLFSLTLIFALVSLAIFFTYRRYPEAATRVDHALKEFNRNVISTRLGRQTTLPTRVNISSPNNDQFFDNPMNTMQQPLMLNVASLGTTTVTTASNSFSDNQFH